MFTDDPSLVVLEWTLFFQNLYYKYMSVPNIGLIDY